MMTKPADETKMASDQAAEENVAKPTDAVKDTALPRRLIIATLPHFKKRQTE
jgi:hypothetical protein